MDDLAGAHVLVAGGGSGIGRATALALASVGARVTVAGRRPAALEEVREAGRQRSLDLRLHPLDVTDASSVAACVEFVRAQEGRIDGLVNCAGTASICASATVSDEEFDRVLDVNLVGAFRLSRAVGSVMLAAGAGSIVHVASLTSRTGMAGRVAYTAAKHGLLGLVRALATEWAAGGVRVNALAPGFVRTPMTDRAVDLGALDVNEIHRRTPAGRRAEPEEMVGPIRFLLSSSASFVTGSCLMADGGWTASIGLPVDDGALSGAGAGPPAGA